MSNRKVIRKILVNAWHNTILKAYENRLINSERSLQSYLSAEVSAELTRNEVSRSIM